MLPFDTTDDLIHGQVGGENAPDFDAIHQIDALWNFYVNHRGIPLQPSCREIESLVSWLARHIPEELLRKAMLQTITEFRAIHTRPGPSLTRCDQEVQRLFRHQLNKTSYETATSPPSFLTTGSLVDEFSRTILPQVESLHRRNMEILARECPATTKQLENALIVLKDQINKTVYTAIEDIESYLHTIDRQVIKLLVSSRQPEEISRLELECQEALAKFKQNMPSKRLKKIIRSLAEERLRNQLRLKPLTSLLIF